MALIRKGSRGLRAQPPSFNKQSVLRLSLTSKTVPGKPEVRLVIGSRTQLELEPRGWSLISKVMHQSFATTSPQGPGNSGDIDFFYMQIPGKISALQGLVLVKSLLKAPTQVNYFVIHGHHEPLQ